MKSSSLVAEIAMDLNDYETGHEYTAWSAVHIRAWIIDALGVVYDQRPDLFKGIEIVQVPPCTTRIEVCQCSKITSVIGQTTSTGRILKRLRSHNDKFLWTGPVCKRRSLPFYLNSYMIDGNNHIIIAPEVPPGVEVWLAIECQKVPELRDDIDFDIDNNLVALVKEWCLWKAKSMDMEEGSGLNAAANAHYTVFKQLLDIAHSREELNK